MVEGFQLPCPTANTTQTRHSCLHCSAPKETTGDDQSVFHGRCWVEALQGSMCQKTRFNLCRLHGALLSPIITVNIHHVFQTRTQASHDMKLVGGGFTRGGIYNRMWPELPRNHFCLGNVPVESKRMTEKASVILGHLYYLYPKLVFLKTVISAN